MRDLIFLCGLFVLVLALVLSGCSDNLVGEAKGGKPGAEPKPECSDKVDNDGDSFIDLDDAGCIDKKDTDESNCGDSVCEGGETCLTCAADCGTCPPVCGDGNCDPTEDCNLCVQDCGSCDNFCGDGVCDSGEDCNLCPDDCGPCENFCGDGVCDSGEDCYTCPPDCGDCMPDSCADSDGGFNTAEQGTVSGYSNAVAYNRTDYCSSDKYLMEYTCMGDSWRSQGYNCDVNNTDRGFCRAGQCEYCVCISGGGCICP